MYVISKNARQWNILVLLVLGLAVAVFAWGLRYKLSLYRSASHNTTHHVAAARLLSNRERPADIVQQIEQATTPAAFTIYFVLTLGAGLLLDPRVQSIWLPQSSRDPLRRPDARALRRLYSRPPPTIY
jgi:hypothetical protein